MQKLVELLLFKLKKKPTQIFIEFDRLLKQKVQPDDDSIGLDEFSECFELLDIDVNKEAIKQIFFNFVLKNGKLSYRLFNEYLYKDFYQVRFEYVKEAFGKFKIP